MVYKHTGTRNGASISMGRLQMGALQCIW